MRVFRSDRLVLSAIAALSVAAGGCGGGDGGGGNGHGNGATQVVVMSRNLYLGAPIEPLLGIDSLTAIPGAAWSLWQTVIASDIPGRAKAIASEIAATQPDLVGLQEATLWRTQSPPDGSVTSAQHVEYDFVQLIRDELAARGLVYDAVATSTNFDQEFTASDGNPLTALDVRMTDRDVILARSGVQVSDAADGRFVNKVQLTVAGILPISIPRGWTSVSAQVSGGPIFRLVNAHLEIGTFAAVQALQAEELVNVLAASALPTISVGDYNSNAIPGGGDDTPSYGIVTGAGFTDAWKTLHPSDAGLTCCQDPALRNATSALWERIDLVLYRGAFTPVGMEVVGASPSDRTPSGVWPSDHAGVVATLRP